MKGITVDKNNFHCGTSAKFKFVGAFQSPANAVSKFGEPHKVSKSGSRYWYTDQGVYRCADHWGAVSTNEWSGDDEMKEAWEIGRRHVVGYAEFNDMSFLPWALHF